jgi:hypothetical protein
LEQPEGETLVAIEGDVTEVAVTDAGEDQGHGLVHGKHDGADGIRVRGGEGVSLIVDNLDLCGRNEGWGWLLWCKWLGEGGPEIKESLFDLLMASPPELLKYQLQVGIHGDEMCLEHGSITEMLALIPIVSDA